MKVAIIGTAPGSRLMAPYQDHEWEIWACSAGNSQSSSLPRVTKWFELHSVTDMVGDENKAWSIPFYAWLRAQSFPIYMQEKNEFIPQAVIFPFKTLTDRFGPNPEKGLSNWFTSSVAWMMAFAIVQMRPGDEIGIFGVDMAASEEHYSGQKAGCLRFIEIAREHGLKVTIPHESCLGKTFPLYGYSESTPMGRKLAVRKYEISSHKTHLDTQIRSLELQRAFFEGALEAVQYDMRTWTDGLDADLETGGKEYLGTMKAAAPKPATTGEYIDKGSGIYMPPFATAGGSVDMPNYEMKADPGVLSSGPTAISRDKEQESDEALASNRSRKKKSLNGETDRAE